MDLFNSFILTYARDLEMHGKAASWREIHGKYSIHGRFMGSPIELLLSPVVFEISTIEQSEEIESEQYCGGNCREGIQRKRKN